MNATILSSTSSTAAVRAALASLAALLTACADPVAECVYDEECAGGEVCAFGTCELKRCNADVDCNGRTCTDGVCAPGTPLAPVEEGAELEGPCRGVVIEPFNGSDDVSPLAQVRVSFGSPEDATHAVVTVDGHDGFRQLRDEAVMVAVPLEPLADAETYTARVTLPCGEVTSTFTVRTPEVQRKAVRASWTLQTADMMPMGMRSLFTMLNIPSLRVSVDDDGGLVGFDEDDGSQERCEATIPLSTLATASPIWNASGLVESLGPSSAGLRELHIRAMDTPAGPEIAAYAEIDGRKIAHWINDGCVEGSSIFPGCVAMACTIVSPALVCEPCSDGAPYCFRFAVHGVATPASAPDPVSATDVCANPGCGDQPECR